MARGSLRTSGKTIYYRMVWGTRRPDGSGMRYKPNVVGNVTKAITYTLGSVSERLGEVLTRCSELDTEDRVGRGACWAQTGMSCNGLGVTNVVGYGLLEVSRLIQRWQ